MAIISDRRLIEAMAGAGWLRFFLPASAHLKMSTIDGEHLGGTPSPRQSANTGRIQYLLRKRLYCAARTARTSETKAFDVQR